MKKLLMAIICLFFASFALQAQDSTAKKTSLKEELGLSKEQVAKYKEITTKNKEAVAAVETDATLDPAAKKAKKKQLAEAKNVEIQAILSEEQKLKWKAYQQKQKAEKETAKKAKQQ